MTTWTKSVGTTLRHSVPTYYPQRTLVIAQEFVALFKEKRYVLRLCFNEGTNAERFSRPVIAVLSLSSAKICAESILTNGTWALYSPERKS